LGFALACRIIGASSPESQTVSNPSFRPFADRGECLQQLATDIAAQLRQHAAPASLLLPGGSSPQALLPLLATQALSWADCRVSPTDERWVPARHAQSNWQLLSRGLPAAHCLDPRLHSDPELAAAAWSEALQDWLPFNAVLLGMGEDAHIASLFPGMPGLARALDPSLQPAALAGRAPEPPHTRLTLNLAMLLATRWLGLLAFGERKRELLEAVLADSPGSREWPLHALLWQPRVPLNIYWAP
jgi:6-phosphogluconolactonase